MAKKTQNDNRNFKNKRLVYSREIKNHRNHKNPKEKGKWSDNTSSIIILQ